MPWQPSFGRPAASRLESQRPRYPHWGGGKPPLQFTRRLIPQSHVPSIHTSKSYATGGISLVATMGAWSSISVRPASAASVRVRSVRLSNLSHARTADHYKSSSRGDSRSQARNLLVILGIPANLRGESWKMTMTTMKCSLAGVRPWALAISMTLMSTCALAQAVGDGASRGDMRLWSFGACERKYPRADTEEYKECMRVVGSAEAKDLRAQRLCEDSYDNDPPGIARCMSAYLATKERPATASVVTAATLSPEMTLKVKAIASAAVAQQDAAAKEVTPAEASTARAGSSLLSRVLVGALVILLLGVSGTLLLRRQA